MMNLPPFVRRPLVSLLMLVILASGYGWHYTHPRYPTKTVSKADYFVDVPTQWTFLTSADRTQISGSTLELAEIAGKKTVIGLTITEESTGTTSANWFAAQYHPNDATSPVVDVHLANGLVARSWTETVSMVEVGYDERWFVFDAPNGRVFTASYPIASGPIENARNERLVRAVLGSLKVKDR